MKIRHVNRESRLQIEIGAFTEILKGRGLNRHREIERKAWQEIERERERERETWGEIRIERYIDRKREIASLLALSPI